MHIPKYKSVIFLSCVFQAATQNVIDIKYVRLLSRKQKEMISRKKSSSLSTKCKNEQKPRIHTSMLK